MYTLIIDGTFMAQRNRNAIGLTFTENPERDKSELIESLATSIAGEFNRFNGVVNRIVWCMDYSSWRKSFNPVLPLETEKTEDEGNYKANRIDDGSYDMAKFFAAVDEFTTILSGLGVCVIKQYKAEADDSAYIASRLLASKGFESILWSSDGDYKTFVSKLVHLFKLPKRELFKVASKPSTDLNAVFGAKPSNFVKIVESVGQESVVEINPAEFVLEQIIRGQGKDNIPPLFFWKKEGKKGGEPIIRTYKPTWNHIKKALDKMNFDLAKLTFDHLYDDQFKRNLILSVLDITKQTRDLDHCLKVWDSSRKLAFVDQREIPEEVWSSVRETLIGEFKTKKLNVNKIKSYQTILDTGTVKTTDTFFGQFDLNDMPS